MSEHEQIVDAEYSDSQAIVPHVEVALSVERDPAVVLAEAHKAAKVLQEVVEGKKNKVKFNGKTYLTFEDWQTVGRFYGVSAKIVSSSFVEYGTVKGFEARAVAVLSSNGVEVSGAEAICLNDEQNWKTKPLYQLKSMAQTRACAKALRNILAFVPVLAGYQPTPAEEMLESGSQEAADEVASRKLREHAEKSKGQRKTSAGVGVDPSKVIFILSYPAKEDGDVLLSGPGVELAGCTRKPEKPESPQHRLITYASLTRFHDVCRNKGITVKDVSNPTADAQ